MNENKFWRLIDSEHPILFERNGTEIRIIYPGNLPAGIQTLNLPITIKNVIPIKKNKFMINTEENNKILTFEDDGRIFLRDLEESEDIPIFFESMSNLRDSSIPNFIARFL